ncbi:MAG: hypothetical protein ACSHYA_17870 [Opitutaceae bacterium]
MKHTWLYDSQNRLKDLSVLNSQLSTLNSYAYTLKASGHRSGISEASGRTVGYSYDNQYRLTQDEARERVDGRTGGSVRRTPQAGALWAAQAQAVTGDPAVVNGTSDWEYDLVGNRLSQTSTLCAKQRVRISYQVKVLII